MTGNEAGEAGWLWRASWAKLMSLELLPGAAGTTEGFQTGKRPDRICVEGRLLRRVTVRCWALGCRTGSHMAREASRWDPGRARGRLAAGLGKREQSKEHGDQAGALEPRGRKVMREEA